MSDSQGRTVDSLGMTMVKLGPGHFTMGSAEGPADERPAHAVRITRGFAMSATPVTNTQYERFDPSHRKLRGKCGLSCDDEAVLFVSWDEATAFCRWLSEIEGVPYRLPSEAEWEYACRAGTTTPYHTGEELPETYHRHQAFGWDPTPVDLTVGTAPPNAWGLHDMHGLVEQWCLDWYGPYPESSAEPLVDPLGPAEGLFRVTRGGSHNTEVRHLRSACRLGTLPEDRTWAVGFRVVQADPPSMAARPVQPVKRWQREVAQSVFDWSASLQTAPVFVDPVPYVIPPDEPGEPFYTHNHCPSITWCDNGDLLAVWFTCVSEGGREMAILASRLRAGARCWEPASEFFNPPGRNTTGSSLFNDGRGRLYHFNGLSVTEGWADLALVVRTSRDSGATWSAPTLADAEHRLGNQVISGTSMTDDGTIIQPCDAVWGASGGTAIHVSHDGGATWHDPASDIDTHFAAGGTGRRIAGIHAGVVGLRDGRLMALGRSDAIDGRMPMSLSDDGGRTWRYHASEFPPISGGQRLVLMRLREGPILLVSFTDDASCWPHPSKPELAEATPVGMALTDSAGRDVRGFGMFAALSYDDGRTWPVRRPVTPDNGTRQLDGGAWTGPFTLSPNHGEPKGYLAATQSPDGMVHLVSSRLHYRFDLAWLEMAKRKSP